MSDEILTAARLHELRKRKGWTQERLARDLGVANATVWRWENGKTTISRAMAQLIRIKLANT